MRGWKTLKSRSQDEGTTQVAFTPPLWVSIRQDTGEDKFEVVLLSSQEAKDLRDILCAEYGLPAPAEDE